jgi:hypothetical protein
MQGPAPNHQTSSETKFYLNKEGKIGKAAFVRMTQASDVFGSVREAFSLLQSKWCANLWRVRIFEANQSVAGVYSTVHMSKKLLFSSGMVKFGF